MTREEQIKQASIEYTFLRGAPMCLGGDAFAELNELNRNYAFEEGAKWADKHPKKGLVRMDKVCEYLEMRLDEYIIRELKQAMEE